MSIAFALLSVVLALLTVGITALHCHNSVEIDKYLADRNR